MNKKRKEKPGLRITRDNNVKVGPRCTSNGCTSNTWVNITIHTKEGRDLYLECTECKRKIFTGSMKDRGKDEKAEEKIHAA